MGDKVCIILASSVRASIDGSVVCQHTKFPTGKEEGITGSPRRPGSPPWLRD